MVSLNRLSPMHLTKLSLCNLDPLTETYDETFYGQYFARWPNMQWCYTRSDGMVVAYIMGKVEKDPDRLILSPNYLPWHGHVTCLTVAPQYRRQGLASKLTDILEDACEREGALFVDLFVRASNEAAIDMYRKMGYSVYRRIVDYYHDDPLGGRDSEDAFDMRKALSADKEGKHLRKNGENYRVMPEELYST